MQKSKDDVKVLVKLKGRRRTDLLEVIELLEGRYDLFSQPINLRPNTGEPGFHCFIDIYEEES